jgi:beta-phosphoglucomutase-like phosphatase (HAD superfamily)
MTTPPTSAVLLDLDGTLVDSVYLHVVAWYETLHAAGFTVPMNRIHAGIGLGSDRLVPWLLGGHRDGTDELSDDHTRGSSSGAELLVPTDGARELLEDLEVRGVPFVVATSAGDEEREALLRRSAARTSRSPAPATSTRRSRRRTSWSPPATSSASTPTTS